MSKPRETNRIRCLVTGKQIPAGLVEALKAHPSTKVYYFKRRDHMRRMAKKVDLVFIPLQEWDYRLFFHIDNFQPVLVTDVKHACSEQSIAEGQLVLEYPFLKSSIGKVLQAYRKNKPNKHNGFIMVRHNDYYRRIFFDEIDKVEKGEASNLISITVNGVTLSVRMRLHDFYQTVPRYMFKRNRDPYDIRKLERRFPKGKMPGYYDRPGTHSTEKVVGKKHSIGRCMYLPEKEWKEAV